MIRSTGLPASTARYGSHVHPHRSTGLFPHGYARREISPENGLCLSARACPMHWGFDRLWPGADHFNALLRCIWQTRRDAGGVLKVFMCVCMCVYLQKSNIVTEFSKNSPASLLSAYPLPNGLYRPGG